MKISLSKVTTKDLATLALRVIESSKSGAYPVIDTNPLLADIEKEYAKYDEVYTKLSYSGKGVEVAKADALRDELFRGIKALLSANMNFSLLPNHADALALYDIFKQYGLDLDRLNYAEETAQMKKLLEALATEENTKRLAAMQLTDAFAQMKKAQQDFEILYAEQAEANAALHNLPSATVIRGRLEEALRNYLNLLTAMKTISGWEMLYADINEIVKGIAHSHRKAKNDVL